jgi:Retrotransposon gag protein
MVEENAAVHAMEEGDEGVPATDVSQELPEVEMEYTLECTPENLGRVDHEVSCLKVKVDTLTELCLAAISKQGKGGNDFKHGTPPVFSGKGKDNIRDWLNAMEDYILVCNVPVAKQVRAACTYLSLGVQSLWRNKVPMLRSAGLDTNTWEVFRTEMLNVFGAVDAERQAREKLQNLKQVGSAEEYCKSFAELVAQITSKPLSDGDAYHRFISGLKEEWHKGVEMLACEKELSLQEAMTLASRFDAVLLKSKAVGSAVEKKLEQPTPTRHGKRPFAALKDHASGSKMAKVHRVHKNLAKNGLPRLPDDEYKKLKEEGACFICKQKGHRAGECPQNSTKKSF